MFRRDDDATLTGERNDSQRSTVVALATWLCLSFLILAITSTFGTRLLVAKQSFLMPAKRSENDDDDEDIDDGSDPFEGRRLRSFERTGIVVPDESIDSRECDDFSDPRECNVTDGYVGCFECVESRYSLRVCVHLAESLRVYDERNDRFFELPANSSSSRGYCLRERLARDVRRLNKGDEGAIGDIGEARRACSARNADWLLIRRRTNVDSSYNFACRCRYPHLMTNVAGPMSACSKDVACNGHGRLDDESRASLADPFVDGRCVCENGWISARDESNGVGPYCREATFAEWPSAFLTKRRYDDLELYSEEVDRAFRLAIEYERLDRVDENGRERKLWLENPCGMCELTVSPEGTYFCGDKVSTSRGGTRIQAIHVGVRRSRDYLRGNGGRLPNACVTFEGENNLWSTRIAVQFMSQDWNDGTIRAQEIGFFVSGIDKLLPDYLWENANVRKFSDALVPAANSRAVPRKWYVLWTYNHYEMREHRAKVWRTLSTFVNACSEKTDLSYMSNDENVVWTDFSFYTLQVYHFYYRMHPYRVNTVTKDGWPIKQQRTYKCPDLRGLDDLSAREGDVQISESEAERVARRMLPICYTPQEEPNGECSYRPELNANHENPSACVIMDAENMVTVYARAFYLPSDMDAARFVSRRNVSLEKRRCPGDP